MKNTNKVDKVNHWDFSFINYTLFLIGICLIALGYYLMYNGDVNSTQSIVISPIILVIGYCVFIPIAIMYKPKD